MDEILRAADEALARAKRTGRDRIVSSDVGDESRSEATQAPS